MATRIQYRPVLTFVKMEELTVLACDVIMSKGAAEYRAKLEKKIDALSNRSDKSSQQKLAHCKYLLFSIDDISAQLRRIDDEEEVSKNADMFYR